MEKELENLKACNRPIIPHRQSRDQQEEYRVPSDQLSSNEIRQAEKDCVITEPTIDATSTVAKKFNTDVSISLRIQKGKEKTFSKPGFYSLSLTNARRRSIEKLPRERLTCSKDGRDKQNELFIDGLRREAIKASQIPEGQAGASALRLTQENTEGSLEQEVFQASLSSQEEDFYYEKPEIKSPQQRRPCYKMVKDTKHKPTERASLTDTRKLTVAAINFQMILNPELWKMDLDPKILLESMLKVVAAILAFALAGFSLQVGLGLVTILLLPEHRQRNWVPDIVILGSSGVLGLLVARPQLLFPKRKPYELDIEPGMSLTALRIVFDEERSLSNYLKASIEHLTGEAWNWWPFRPSFRSLRSDEVRIEWQCVSEE